MTFEVQRKARLAESLKKMGAQERKARLAEILKKMAGQLAWRGPTGRMQDHIVLDRDDAVELLGQVIYLSGGSDESVNT
jgi:hypothetical protein